MILATMDKFHYPINEINSYIDNIESIIIDSKRISESDKQNYLTNLPNKYIEHTDKKDVMLQPRYMVHMIARKYGL